MAKIEFINTSGVLGQVIEGITMYVTGDLYLTFMLLLMFFAMIGLVLRIPFEVIMFLIIPIGIVITSVYGSFIQIIGIVFFFIAIIFAKIFFL